MLGLVSWFHIAIQFIKFVYTIFLVYCSLLLVRFCFNSLVKMWHWAKMNTCTTTMDGKKSCQEFVSSVLCNYVTTHRNKIETTIKGAKKNVVFNFFFSIFLHCWVEAEVVIFKSLGFLIISYSLSLPDGFLLLVRPWKERGMNVQLLQSALKWCVFFFLTKCKKE